MFISFFILLYILIIHRASQIQSHGVGNVDDDEKKMYKDKKRKFYFNFMK